MCPPSSCYPRLRGCSVSYQLNSVGLKHLSGFHIDPGSMCGFMSATISSANRVSMILSYVNSPLILRISEVFFGGYFLGTGVDISFLYNLGYSPLLILVLIISVSGSARYAANILVSFGGKSPWIVALFVFS